jgi:hypothetical protein
VLLKLATAVEWYSKTGSRDKLPLTQFRETALLSIAGKTDFYNESAQVQCSQSAIQLRNQCACSLHYHCCCDSSSAYYAVLLRVNHVNVKQMLGRHYAVRYSCSSLPTKWRV